MIHNKILVISPTDSACTSLRFHRLGFDVNSHPELFLKSIARFVNFRLLWVGLAVASDAASVFSETL